MTSLRLFIWKMMQMYFQKVMSWKIFFCGRLEGRWRKQPDPDPLVTGKDPRIQIHTKMAWICNTGFLLTSWGQWRKWQDPDPNPLVRGTDPRIRIRTKMDPQHCSSWLGNCVCVCLTWDLSGDDAGLRTQLHRFPRLKLAASRSAHY